MFNIGEVVKHPINGIATVVSIDAHHVGLKYGNKPPVKMPVNHPVTSLLKKATDAEKEQASPYILWVDPDTGAEVKLDKKYLSAIKFLGLGRDNTVSAKSMLELMEETDTDSNRRQLRGVFDYLINEKSVAVCSATSFKGGYFVADCSSDLEETAIEKQKKAVNLQRSASKLLSMDVEISKNAFEKLKTSQK